MKFIGAIVLAWVGLLPTHANADQNHPQLNSLFETLKQVQTPFEAKDIETQIWQAWLDAPNRSAADLLSQLNAAMSVNQNELALRFANQLVDSEPQFAEAWNKRATIHYLQGNHSLSIADITETLALEPRHFGALSGLGLIFLNSGNNEAALDVFNKVLAINPQSKHAKAGIARAQLKIGEDI